MTITFEPPVAVYSAERTNGKKISDFNNIIGLKETFRADAVSGFGPERKITSESYTGVIEARNPTAQYAAYVKVHSKWPGIYPDLLGGFSTDWAERTMDDGATAHELEDERNWQMVLSSTVAATGDKFQLRVKIDKVIASNYKNQSTLDVLEAFCASNLDN